MKYQIYAIFFNILYPSQKSINLLKKLVAKYQPKGNHIYDIEIISIMLCNNIKNIATMNKKDFQNIEEINIVESV